MVFSADAVPTKPIVPSGKAVYQNGEMSWNIVVACGSMNPARPCVAPQYGTQPLTKRFGLHALSTIIAAATSVARQQPLLRTVATGSRVVATPRDVRASAQRQRLRRTADEPTLLAHPVLDQFGDLPAQLLVLSDAQL